MYHEKYDFNDFISGAISNNHRAITIDNRQVYAANEKLKTYHSFLNLFLFEYLKVNNEVVFSYRKGVNAYDAVVKHADNRYFFQSDISCFFNSLNSELVRSTIITSADASPIADIEQYLDRIVDLVTIDSVLPIGFATSPPISNACLFEFDNRLHAYCQAHQLIYTRYSDDLIISSSHKEALTNISSVVESLLQACFGSSLNMNVSKSKFTHKGNKIKLLGMVILPNGKVTVDIKFKSKIEVLLHFYINDREKYIQYLAQISSDSSGLKLISGYLNYINTIDPHYVDKLRKKYGVTVVDMFIHQSVK